MTVARGVVPMDAKTPRHCHERLGSNTSAESWNLYCKTLALLRLARPGSLTLGGGAPLVGIVEFLANRLRDAAIAALRVRSRGHQAPLRFRYAVPFAGLPF